MLASDAFFPFSTGRCALEAGSRRSSSPVARSATTRSSRRCPKPAPRWSSPAGVTSGTDGRGRPRRSPARLLLRRGERPATTTGGVCALGMSPDEIAAASASPRRACARAAPARTTSGWRIRSASHRLHRVRSGGRTWTGTRCWDALGIPGALHADGEVATSARAAGMHSNSSYAPASSSRAPTSCATFSCPRAAGGTTATSANDGLPPVGGHLERWLAANDWKPG